MSSTALSTLSRKLANNYSNQSAAHPHRCSSCPGIFLTLQALQNHDIKKHSISNRATANTTADITSTSTNKITIADVNPSTNKITTANAKTSATSKTDSQSATSKATSADSTSAASEAAPIISASNAKNSAVSLTSPSETASETTAGNRSYLPNNYPSLPVKIAEKISLKATGLKFNHTARQSPYFAPVKHIQTYSNNGNSVTKSSSYFNLGRQNYKFIRNPVVKNSVIQNLSNKKTSPVALKNCRYCKIPFFDPIELIKHENKHSQRDINNPTMFNNNSNQLGSKAIKKPLPINFAKSLKTVFCDICGSRHASKINMLAHKAFVHFDKFNEVGRGWKCAFCFSHYSTEQFLLTHVVKDHDTLGPKLSTKIRKL